MIHVNICQNYFIYIIKFDDPKTVEQLNKTYNFIISQKLDVALFLLSFLDLKDIPTLILSLYQRGTKKQSYKKN